MISNIVVTSSINRSLIFSPLAVAYDLPKPVRPTSFNFNKLTSEVNIDDFLSDSNYFPFSFSNSRFADKNYGHVVTGDLQPIENNKLRKLFCKGPMYRELTCINLYSAMKDIFSSIDECIESWSKEKVINNWSQPTGRVLLPGY